MTDTSPTIIFYSCTKLSCKIHRSSSNDLVVNYLYSLMYLSVFFSVCLDLHYLTLESLTTIMGKAERSALLGLSRRVDGRGNGTGWSAATSLWKWQRAQRPHITGLYVMLTLHTAFQQSPSEALLQPLLRLSCSPPPALAPSSSSPSSRSA